MHLHPLLAISVVALTAVAHGQTYIVDANNGPGTQFLDIPPAVAVVPSGSTLRVRAGSYSAFTVTGKSISILGDGSAVTLRGVNVGPIGASGRFILKDVRIAGMSPVNIASVHGHVLLDSILFAPSILLDADWFTIAASADVHLHGITGESGATNNLRIDGSCVELSACNLVGRRQPTAGATGFPAVWASRSRLVVSGTTLTGGKGGTDLFNLFGEGGAGLELVAATADLGAGNVLVGGEGGIDPTGLGCYQVMRAGGPGLRLTQSTARSLGTTLRGGPGPCLVCPSTPCGTFGPPLLADAGSTFSTPPGVAPLARLLGMPRLNSSVDFTLRAGASEVALLAFGFTPACVPWPSVVDFGGILALPEIVVGPLVTDGSGAASYRLPLPAAFVTDRMVWAQFFTFPGLILPGLGSNSVPFVVKS